MKREFMNYLKDEDGQTSTEYILLVAVVEVIIFKFKNTLGTALDELVGKVFGKANKIADELN
jgi:pilus assembly protein Flp/PilA